MAYAVICIIIISSSSITRSVQRPQKAADNQKRLLGRGGDMRRTECPSSYKMVSSFSRLTVRGLPAMMVDAADGVLALLSLVTRKMPRVAALNRLLLFN